MQLNSLHAVRLTLGDQSIVVKGRVAHCRISDVDQDIITYRTGIEFIEPSERVYHAADPALWLRRAAERDQAAIDRWVKERWPAIKVVVVTPCDQRDAP